MFNKNLSLKKIIFFVFCIVTSILVFFLCLLQSGQEHNIYIHAQVKKYNDTSFLIRVNSANYRGKLSIGDSFSNTHTFFKVISEDNKKNDYLEYSGGYLEYIIQFPIFWIEPYAYFSKNVGVSESTFLFVRPISGKAYFSIDFSDLNISVYNSLAGSNKKFYLSQEQLFNSYFVFGNYTSCFQNHMDINLTIIFGEIDTNVSLCHHINLLFDYYYKNFGNPFKIHNISYIPRDYTIGFFPATSFSSLYSGFFRSSLNLDMISHELFHLWEPNDVTCSNVLLFRESLASFMQIYSLYEVGLITNETMENIFSEKLKKYTNSVNNSKYYSEQELFELRKTDDDLYYILVYYRGSLIWKQIQDSGISVVELYKKYLTSNNCSEISDLFSTYETKMKP